MTFAPYFLCIWVYKCECYIASEDHVYTFFLYSKVRNSDYFTFGPVIVNVLFFCGFYNYFPVGLVYTYVVLNIYIYIYVCVCVVYLN